MLHGFSFEMVWYNSATLSKDKIISSKSFSVIDSGLSNLTKGIMLCLREKWSSAASFIPYNWNADKFTADTGLWITLAYSSSCIFKVSSFLMVWSIFKVSTALTVVAFWRSFRNFLRLVLCEWSSKTNLPKPTLVSLSFTTSNAAIFSDTNKTDLPSASNSAIKLTIVCDLPVPGGPSTTRFLPAFTSWIAAICDESASKTWYIDWYWSCESMSSSLNASTLFFAGLKIAWINSFLVKSTFASQLSGFKSLYITNFVKLKKPNAISWLTLQFSILWTACFTFSI